MKKYLRRSDFESDEEEYEFIDCVNANPDYDEATRELGAVLCSQSDDDDAYWEALGRIYWEEFGILSKSDD